MNQCKKSIYKNLSYGNFSLKVVYTLLDVLDRLNYEDKFIYRDL
jgi:hypothetical protein